jgi:hypothetical protein
MSMPRRLVGLLLLTLAAGCQQPGAIGDFPPFTPVGAETVLEQNPVYVPLGLESYGQVFENVLSVLIDSGFEILESNRYDGRIETLPRIAPGLGLCCKRGSPDCYDRLLATAQSYRHRVSIAIQPGDNKDYFIEVIVRKELEDVPRPIRMTAGGAVFRTDNNIDRTFEVIDANIFEPTWFFVGRDVTMEQELIRRLKRCM